MPFCAGRAVLFAFCLSQCLPAKSLEATGRKGQVYTVFQIAQTRPKTFEQPRLSLKYLFNLQPDNPKSNNEALRLTEAEINKIPIKQIKNNLKKVSMDYLDPSDLRVDEYDILDRIDETAIKPIGKVKKLKVVCTNDLCVEYKPMQSLLRTKYSSESQSAESTRESKEVSNEDKSHNYARDFIDRTRMQSSLRNRPDEPDSVAFIDGILPDTFLSVDNTKGKPFGNSQFSIDYLDPSDLRADEDDSDDTQLSRKFMKNEQKSKKKIVPTRKKKVVESTTEKKQKKPVKKTVIKKKEIKKEVSEKEESNAKEEADEKEETDGENNNKEIEEPAKVSERAHEDREVDVEEESSVGDNTTESKEDKAAASEKDLHFREETDSNTDSEEVTTAKSAKSKKKEHSKAPKRFEVIENSKKTQQIQSDYEQSEEEKKPPVKPKKKKKKVSETSDIASANAESQSVEKPNTPKPKQKKSKPKHKNSDEGMAIEFKPNVPDKYVYMQGAGRLIKNGANVQLPRRDIRRGYRLPHFMPKRFFWDVDDFKNLGIYWFNGPQSRYPEGQRFGEW